MAHSSRAWENNWVAHHELQWFVLFCLISWTISNTLTCVFIWIRMLSHISHWWKTCSIYISIVFVPFHKFAQAFPLIRFPVNSSSALGLAPGSPIIHIWMEICASFPASIVLWEKIWWGITSNLRKRYFVHRWCSFEDVRCKFPLATERDLMTNSLARHNTTLESFNEKKQRNKGLDVMSRTGSCLDIQPVRVISIIGSSNLGQTPKY